MTDKYKHDSSPVNISEILRQLNQVNRELEKMRYISEDDQSPILGSDYEHLKIAKSLLFIWNSRVGFLDRSLLSDPGWSILLSLKVAELSQQNSQVSTVCIDSGVPATTALRWIKLLESKSLVQIEPDKHDGRRKFVSLTSNASEIMKKYLENIRKYTMT